MGELVTELAPLLRGRVLRDVQALPPRDLLLIFEPAAGAGGPPLRLRLSADHSAPRIHLQHGRVPGHDGPPGPFFRQLKADLQGATLASLDQVRGDRIVLLDFRNTPAGGRRGLLAELTGRGSNIFLLGPGDCLEAALAVPAAPANASGARRTLRPGQPWQAPPTGPPPPAPVPLAEAFPAPPPYQPPGSGAAPGPDEAQARPAAPLSWIVEASLGAQALATRGEALRNATRRRLERRLARTRSRQKGLAQRATAAAGSERSRQDGDLLQANLHRLRRGLRELVVDDLYREQAASDDGPPQRTLALDPRLSPQQNVERFYKRHRKLERDGRTVHAERERLERTVLALEDHLARLEQGADPAELDREAVAAGLLEAPQEADPRRRRPQRQRLPYLTFAAASGSEIRVGRSARDNDALTLRHCRGNDLWLHTADAPGSHVVLVGQRGREADPEDILDAAHLAVHFSPLKGARKADVHLAQRKHVHKPRGAKPGLVTLSGGKVLQVRMEEQRLEQLLRSQGS